MWCKRGRIRTGTAGYSRCPDPKLVAGSRSKNFGWSPGGDGAPPSRALTAALPAVHRAVVEPGESAVLSGGQPGTHHIEGGGIGHRPPQLHPADYDEVIAVPEAEAFETARQAARLEGIFSGPSTGANLAAALGIASRLGPGHRVVTIQVDSGLKYLAGHLYS